MEGEIEDEGRPLQLRSPTMVDRDGRTQRWHSVVALGGARHGGGVVGAALLGDAHLDIEVLATCSATVHLIFVPALPSTTAADLHSLPPMVTPYTPTCP